MESSLLLIIISFIFSAISLLISFIGLGIKITQEFSEKPDVLDRKKNIESYLREQLNEEWKELILKYPEKNEFGEKAVEDFFMYGLNAFVCTLPSVIIEDISSLTSVMISNFAKIIISIVGIAFSYWFFYYETPFLSLVQKNSIVIGILLISLFVAYENLKNMKNMIPKIVKLRQKFFQLESRNLKEVREMWDAMRESNLI